MLTLQKNSEWGQLGTQPRSHCVSLFKDNNRMFIAGAGLSKIECASFDVYSL
jgi:hypothetical protein